MTIMISLTYLAQDSNYSLRLYISYKSNYSLSNKLVLKSFGVITVLHRALLSSSLILFYLKAGPYPIQTAFNFGIVI